MSESAMEPTPANASGAADEEEISWEDAVADLERQKQMIKAQSPAVAAAPARAPEPAPPAAEEAATANLPNLKFVLDIPLQVTVELGRKKLLVHDLLRLSQGSVIELTKQIGEPFEVFVNQKLIARGEVVVIND